MIIQFKTYGKIPIHKKVMNDLRDRFSINPHTNNILMSKGLKPYIPKLNKIRFTLGLVGVVVCVVVPLITPLLVFPLAWSLR